MSPIQIFIICVIVIGVGLIIVMSRLQKKPIRKVKTKKSNPRTSTRAEARSNTKAKARPLSRRARAKADKRAKKAKEKAAKRAQKAKEKEKKIAERRTKIEKMLNAKDLITIQYTNYKSETKYFEIHKTTIVNKDSFIKVHVMPKNKPITLRKANITDYDQLIKQLPKSELQKIESKLKGKAAFDLIYNNFSNVTNTIPVDVATIRYRGTFISAVTLRSRKRLSFKIHKIQNLDELRPLVDSIDKSKHITNNEKKQLLKDIQDCIIKQ
jgi:hypothetical protein